jgi:hypothetical protein
MGIVRRIQSRKKSISQFDPAITVQESFFKLFQCHLLCCHGFGHGQVSKRNGNAELMVDYGPTTAIRKVCPLKSAMIA